MKRNLFDSVCSVKRSLMFFAVAAGLAIIGGYQQSQLFLEVSESSALRSVQLLEIEESLDDAAIGLGRQIREWKDMLLRVDEKVMYGKHQQAFKDASIAVQYALVRGKTIMQNVGMETTEMDQLIVEHKALLAEYLQAYAKLKPEVAAAPSAVDKLVIGVDRQLQARISSVKVLSRTMPSSSCIGHRKHRVIERC